MSNNIHQIPGLESAELQEEWTEEEKIPVKKDTPAQAKPEAAPTGDQPVAGDVPMADATQQ